MKSKNDNLLGHVQHLVVTLTEVEPELHATTPTKEPMYGA